MKNRKKSGLPYGEFFNLALLVVILSAAGFYIWFMTGFRHMLPFVVLGVLGLCLVAHMQLLKREADKRRRRRNLTEEKEDTDD